MQVSTYLSIFGGEREELAMLMLTGDIGDLYLINSLSDFDKLPDKARLRLLDEYGRLLMELKKLMDDLDFERLPLAEIDINYDDIDDEWVEFNTAGIVFGRIIGKKSYRFTPSIPSYMVVRYRDGTETFLKYEVPSFEVFVDILSFELPDGRTVRRFWDWRGVIEVYYVARLRDGRLYKKKVGEVKVDWLGHKPLLEAAERIVRRLKKQRRQLIELRNKAETKTMKAKITRQIKKLEEKIKHYVRLKQRHYKVGIRVWGKIADERIEEEIPAFISMEVKELQWGNQELVILERKDLDNFIVKHEIVVEKEFTFYGRMGKLNHELRVTGIPKRKVKVASWVQTRPVYYKRQLPVCKHPVTVKEIDSDYRMWIIEPLDGVSRVILHSKDHAREGLDRILLHLDNTVAVFIHKL